MNKKIMLLLALAVFVSLSQLASADVMTPGTKYIDWCYEVSNVNDYPDYVFIYNDERVSGHGIINDGDCFNFYKLGLTSIYAIKKSDFNEGELNREYFSENNTKLIRSNLQVSAFGSVKSSDPLEKAVVTLKVNSLSGDNLEIQKDKITYTYKDGTSEVKVFSDQNINPEPSKKAFQYWYIIVPVVAIILISAILLFRRMKK